MIPHVVDFETDAIERHPHYPPKPCGVSIWHAAAEKPRYWAWGHPNGNNCTWEEGKAALAAIWDQECLFHNGRFDTEVAFAHFGLMPNPDPWKVHDTLFLNYLYDPNAETLSLKPSAERILGLPPTEQQELQAWLKSKGLRAFDYALAPGDLVAKYADGDTLRTRGLFEHLMPLINSQGMLAAYRREQSLAPILNANQRDGIRIDQAKLEYDLVRFEEVQREVTARLLGIIGPCNPDSSAELARALLNSGRAQEMDFLRTPTGKLATNKASMDRAVKNPELRQLLGYRGNLKTLLTTFMRKWAEIGAANDGYVHPDFNQVRGEEYGTRTGRLSSSHPNMQNIPTEFKVRAPAGLPDLPFMRQYVLPDDGEVLVSADFNSQEFRIAAHFAEGRAAEIYRNDPAADFHAAVAEIIRTEAGLTLPRKDVKIAGFSLLYGSGLDNLAEQLGVTRPVAQQIRKHYFQALPGLKDLMDEVSARGRKGLAVKTWGGRLLYSEKPKIVKGQQWDFSYKLTNYLIQGSAADQTKEAINRLGYFGRSRRFLLTVHDENVYSVMTDHLKENIAEIRAVMEDGTGWDIPWKIKVEVGNNFHDMEEYK